MMPLKVMTDGNWEKKKPGKEDSRDNPIKKEESPENLRRITVSHYFPPPLSLYRP